MSIKVDIRGESARCQFKISHADKSDRSHRAPPQAGLAAAQALATAVDLLDATGWPKGPNSDAAAWNG